MEDKEKVLTTPEPNPTGEDEVKTTDLKDETKPSEPSAEEGKETSKEEESNAEEEGNTDPKPQDRDTNAKNAERRRRQKEREEQRQREREDEIRRQAVFEVKSGQVTADELKELSLPKVETEEQLFLVEQLRKAKSEGAENPQAEAYKALFKKQSDDKAKAEAQAKAEAEAEARRKEVVAKDQQAFKAKFGKTTAEVMKNEEEFMSLFGNLIDQDKGNFTELYSAYTTLKKERKDTAKKDGSFPTSSESGSSSSGNDESDADFKKRWIAEHGRW